MVFKKMSKKEEEKEEIEEIKEEMKKEEGAEICEVPTNMTLAFKTETGEILPEHEFLVRIYNKILKIEKAVV